MKPYIIALMLCVTILPATNAQQNTDGSPSEKFKVTKRFDDKGNLIGYDSLYIRQFSMDTTIRLGVAWDSLFSFPGIDRFMRNIWNDSVLASHIRAYQPFSFSFKFAPFDEESYGNDRKPGQEDSLFRFDFPYRFDSLFFNFGLDTADELLKNSELDLFEDFEKHLNESISGFRGKFFYSPDFQYSEHQKEWDELMQTHQKEIDKLYKKWEEFKSDTY